MKLPVSAVAALQHLPATSLKSLDFSVSPNIHGWQRKQLQPQLGYLTALTELSCTGEGLFAVQVHDILPPALRELTGLCTTQWLSLRVTDCLSIGCQFGWSDGLDCCCVIGNHTTGGRCMSMGPALQFLQQATYCQRAWIPTSYICNFCWSVVRHYVMQSDHHHRSGWCASTGITSQSTDLSDHE